MKLERKNLIKLFIYVLIGVAIVNIPNMSSSSYIIRVVNMSMITYIVALSVYVLLGLTGQNSFTQAGLWGMGAYLSANLLVKLGMGSFTSLVLAIIGTALFSFILGFAIFRLKDFYFTFSTIGLMVILNSLFLNWSPVTGGALGFSNIPNFKLFGFEFSSINQYFYLILFFAIIATIAVLLVYKSSLGRMFMAIRDNELAANTLGINSVLTKSIAFAISGALCGLAGALYASMSGYLSSMTFTYNQSTLYLVMIMLGGTKTPLGALIGSIGLTLTQEILRPLQNYMLLIFGAGIMLLMIVQPDGILGGIEYVKEKFFSREKNTRTTEYK